MLGNISGYAAMQQISVKITDFRHARTAHNRA